MLRQLFTKHFSNKTRYFLLILLFSIQFYSYSQTAEFNKITSKGKFTEYISKDKKSVKINDTIQIGLPSAGNNFVYITQGNVGVMPFLANTKAVVKEIKSVGKKETGFKIYLLFKGYGLLPVYIDYETALLTGEVTQ